MESHKKMENLTARERITKIAEIWFLKEPLLFGVFCTHKISENEDIKVAFRCGKMRIEFNPAILSKKTDAELEELLKIEVVRIILKHPYQRIPPCPNRIVLSLASDITISDVMETRVRLPRAEDFKLPKNLSFEEYYVKLLSDMKTKLDSFELGNESALTQEQFRELTEKYDCSELWDEDSEAAETINAEIERAQMSNGWGSIKGELQEIIEATLVITMDYRRMLAMFRATIISSARRLTRMKPNRRYGFTAMGSQNEFSTGLLVAVDVSGSISTEALSRFFSIVNRFFKYGMKKIDVIQFDADITADILSLKKARSKVEVTGRGGTDFQPALDFYANSNEYDGLIIFTDGCASVPKMESTKRVLWVLTSKAEYNSFCKEMLPSLPSSKATYIPL